MLTTRMPWDNDDVMLEKDALKAEKLERLRDEFAMTANVKAEDVPINALSELSGIDMKTAKGLDYWIGFYKAELALKYIYADAALKAREIK